MKLNMNNLLKEGFEGAFFFIVIQYTFFTKYIFEELVD